MQYAKKQGTWHALRPGTFELGCVELVTGKPAVTTSDVTPVPGEGARCPRCFGRKVERLAKGAVS